MQTKKTKLAIAIGSIGLFMGAAQLAHAGLVEVNVGAKVPTFSTDISGPGSDNQPFFAPDVRWTPGENIGNNASVRFNLGGKDGDPARFATNAIDVNNFVLVARTPIANAYTAAPTVTQAAAVSTALLPAEQTVLGTALVQAVNSTVAQRLAAVNAAVAAATVGGAVLAPAGVLNTVDANGQTAMTAAAQAQLHPADSAVAAQITAALVASAGTKDGFPATDIAGHVAAGSYTNGDSALWMDSTLAPNSFGRIFQSTTSGGVNSFDVTVLVRTPLTGDADAEANGLTGDSIVLSLNTGKYIDVSNNPVTFGTGPLLDTNVDITNLKAQGFDGTTVDGYPASGTINMIVSVQQGGVTRDSGNTGNSNRTLYAASANPLQFIGFPGLAGSNAAASFPTTINLAAEELRFSGNHGIATWYSNDLDLPAQSDLFNHIGSFRFDLANLTGTAQKSYNDWSVGGPNGGNIPYGQISDPIGNPYALTAGDTIGLTIAVAGNLSNALAPFTGAGAYFLRSGAGDCTGAFGGSDVALTVNVEDGTASNASASLISGTTYTVCARANGTSEIVPHTANVTATLNNIEPTYQNPTFGPTTLGTWVRNGCDATFFNVPGNGPAATGVDKGFLRFTNTTAAATPGNVRARVWGQDGREVGTGKLLATTGSAGLNGSLTGHQTGVYNAHDVARAIGLSPENDSVNVFPGERVRVVLSGGFATCEGQNMIASPAGVLTNVTVTTNANTNSINTAGREGFAGNNSN